DSGLNPSRSATRSTEMVASALLDISIISAPGLPTATVIRAYGKRSRIAPSAGRLITTSPSWPKSMTRILQGSKVTSDAYRKSLRWHDTRVPNPDVAENHEIGRASCRE